MKTNDLKKLLSGLSIVSLLAGVGMGATGCSTTGTGSPAEVQHPTPGSAPTHMSS